METKTLIFFISLLAILVLSSFVHALPSAPTLTYVSNSTKAVSSTNRSVDEKGTITVLTVSLDQQDYKWKAYVGNVSGALVLDDANSKSIYDWSMGSPSGEIYVTRTSGTVSWADIECANQTVIDAEQSALGLSSSSIDSINATFNNTVHKSFLVGTTNITTSSCRAIATYVNDAAQAVSESAYFQEVLLQDTVNTNIIYTALLEADYTSYYGAGITYDFQVLLAENESSTVPLNYYFYVELG